MCRGLLFATGGSVDLVNLSPDPNDPCDKLQVKALFPNGAVSIKLLELPVTREKLIYDHRIIISSGRGPTPLNNSIEQALGIQWRGNIVIVPYSISGKQRRKMNSVPWGHASFQFLTLVLKR